MREHDGQEAEERILKEERIQRVNKLKGKPGKSAQTKMRERSEKWARR